MKSGGFMNPLHKSCFYLHHGETFGIIMQIVDVELAVGSNLGRGKHPNSLVNK